MALKHLWMKLRDLMRFLWAKSKFDFVPQGRADGFSFATCHHIVVLKLDGKLGDTQVMSHFYNALRQHNPSIYLSVVCSPNLAEIYRDILGFDQVITAPRKPRFKEIKQLCQQIQEKTPVSVVGSIANKVDLVITTEPNFRPRDFFFNHLLQPRYVAGCETRVDCVNILIYDPSAKTKKVAECFIDLMDKYGLEHDELAYTRFVTPESLAKMSRWLHMPSTVLANEPIEHGSAQSGHVSPLHARRYLLAINPRASSASRSMTDDTVINLIQALQAKFGSVEVKSHNSEESTAPHVANAEVINVSAEELSISESGASTAQAASVEGAKPQVSKTPTYKTQVSETQESTLADSTHESAHDTAIPENAPTLAPQTGETTVAPSVEYVEADSTQESSQVSTDFTDAQAETTVGGLAQDIVAQVATKSELLHNEASSSVDTSTNMDTSISSAGTDSVEATGQDKADVDVAKGAEATAAVASEEVLPAVVESQGEYVEVMSKNFAPDEEQLVDAHSPLSNYDLEFVVLTPPDANELKNKVKAAALNCGASVLFLPENSTVLDLSSTIELCDALITVDTAAVHMACASEKPQLCVYTGTNSNESTRWAPIGQLAQVVRFEGKTVPEIKDQVLIDLSIDFLLRYM